MNIPSNCPVCGKEKLNIGWEKKELWIDGKAYPSLILMNKCSACGYERPKSCNIELLIDGSNPEDIPQLSKEERENVLRKKNSCNAFTKPAHRKYDLLSFIRGNGLATEKYLKELEESSQNISKDRYRILAGKKRAHVAEQVRNIPKCRAILDDHLVDTEDSKLVLHTQNETNARTGDMIQHFYFLSSEGVFYRIIVRPNGRQDAPRRMTSEEMKKILSKQSPDLYLEYFPLTHIATNGEDNSLDNLIGIDPRPKTYENAPRVLSCPLEAAPIVIPVATISEEATDKSPSSKEPAKIIEERREELKRAYAEDDPIDMTEEFFNSMADSSNADVIISEEENPTRFFSRQDDTKQKKEPINGNAANGKTACGENNYVKPDIKSIMKTLPIPKNGFIRPKRN